MCISALSFKAEGNTAIVTKPYHIKKWTRTSQFVCVEILRPNGVMSSVVSLPNHTFPGQA